MIILTQEQLEAISVRCDQCAEYNVPSIDDVPVDMIRALVEMAREFYRKKNEVEALKAGVRQALSYANGRWEEWGERALKVEEMLDSLLTKED